MSFLNPGAFWLLSLAPLIVLLYLLKLRREDQPVSSTYLWRRLVRDMQANAPWQRLQPNLLLFLQLLFLITLILAITRPFSWMQGVESKAVILIFDTSASMSARDISPNRLQAAKASAIQLVENLSGDARITVISAGANSRTLVSLSQDRKLVQQAISQLQPTAGGADLVTALQIASAIAQRQVDSQTVIYTDGNFDLPETAGMPANLRWEIIGNSAENQAVELLTIQKNPIDRTLTAFAQIANYSPSPVKRRVAIIADGATMNVADVEIPANQSQPVIASGILSATQVVEAKLLPSETAVDLLELDDDVFVVNRKVTPSRVALVSSGNRFLETALSLLPQIELDFKQPSDPLQPDTKLVIYDGVSPAGEIPPGASILFIGPLESTEFFTVTGQLKLPVPLTPDLDDPLVQDVDLKGVSILDAARIVPPHWSKTIVQDALSTEPQPALLFAGENAGHRIAVISFNLNHSDLPLQVAFPILISNLVNWLTPGAAGLVPAAVAPGEAVPLGAAISADNDPSKPILITRPDGTTLQLDPTSTNPVFDDTGQPGIYTISLSDGANYKFAVNLFAPEESRIAPRQTALPGAGSAQVGQTAAQQSRREWWRPLTVLALIFLTIEWLVFHRAALSRLVSKLKGISPLQKRPAR